MSGTIMRSSKFYTHVRPYIAKIDRWARQGATEKEIAKNLGVSYSSFMSYLAKGKNGEADFSEFSDTLARACADANNDVEAALYRLATGYTVPVKKPIKVRRIEYDESGRKIREYEEVVLALEEKHVEPDVRAQMFWLTNRSRDRWEHRPISIRSPDTGEETGVVFISTAPQLTPPQGESVIDGNGEVVQ